MKILKNVYISLIFALVIICGILFVDFLRAPNITVSKPSPNYVVYSTISNGDGKIEKMITFKTNYEELGIDDEKSKQIQSELEKKMQNLLEDEKKILKVHDNTLADVEFSTLNESNIVGYVITFPSFDVYDAYCNSLHREVKKGAFIDKITQKTKYPLTSEDEARYKKLLVEIIASVADKDIILYFIMNMFP